MVSKDVNCILSHLSLARKRARSGSGGKVGQKRSGQGKKTHFGRLADAMCDAVHTEGQLAFFPAPWYHDKQTHSFNN